MEGSDNGPLNIAKLVINNQEKSVLQRSTPVKTYSKKTSPDSGNDGKSRYGRMHKRNVNEDFLSTDVKVSNYLKTESVSRKHYFKGSPVAKLKSPVPISSPRPRGRPRKSLSSIDLVQTTDIEKKNLNLSAPCVLDDLLDFQAPVPTSTETLPLPRELKKEELLSDDSGCDDADWNCGDLAWASIGGFSYWPCAITKDPVEMKFKKTQTLGRSIIPIVMLHVRFFGDNGRRSWVKATRVMSFTGHDDYQAQVADFTTPECKKKDFKTYRMYVVAPSMRKSWQAAVSEAESLLEAPRSERIMYFHNLYAESDMKAAEPESFENKPKKRGRKRKSELVGEEGAATDMKKLKTEDDIKKEEIEEEMDLDLSPSSHVVDAKDGGLLNSKLDGDVDPSILASVLKATPKPPITPRAIYMTPNLGKMKYKQKSKPNYDFVPVKKPYLKKSVEENIKCEGGGSPTTGNADTLLTPGKRPRGRPRKSPKSRGRPRKNPLSPSVTTPVQAVAAKGPVGRPRKTPLPTNTGQNEAATTAKMKGPPTGPNFSSRSKNAGVKPKVKSMIGFEAYREQHLDRVADENPDLSPEDIEKYLERLWTEMPENLKTRYKSKVIDDSGSEGEETKVNLNLSSTPLASPSSVKINQGVKRIPSLFVGIRVDRVCEVCLKGDDKVVRCKGPCSRYYHVLCGDARTTIVPPGQKSSSETPACEQQQSAKKRARCRSTDSKGPRKSQNTLSNKKPLDPVVVDGLTPPTSDNSDNTEDSLTDSEIKVKKPSTDAVDDKNAVPVGEEKSNVLKGDSNLENGTECSSNVSCDPSEESKSNAENEMDSHSNVNCDPPEESKKNPENSHSDMNCVSSDAAEDSKENGAENSTTFVEGDDKGISKSLVDGEVILLNGDDRLSENTDGLEKMDTDPIPNGVVDAAESSKVDSNVIEDNIESEEKQNGITEENNFELNEKLNDDIGNGGTREVDGKLNDTKKEDQGESDPKLNDINMTKEVDAKSNELISVEQEIRETKEKADSIESVKSNEQTVGNGSNCDTSTKDLELETSGKTCDGNSKTPDEAISSELLVNGENTEESENQKKEEIVVKEEVKSEKSERLKTIDLKNDTKTNARGSGGKARESKNSDLESENGKGKGSKWVCAVCRDDLEDPCFVCGKGEDKLIRCSVNACGRMYHESCLEYWPQATFSQSFKGRVHVTCPQHACHTCISDNPQANLPKFGGDRVVRCLKCPTTYHHSNYCIPAGTEILSNNQIICPRHYKGSHNKALHHINAAWCFICSVGGSLICCEHCPNSFHVECLKIEPPAGKYVCEDCETGRYPLYGEIVWVKLGSYRWWPAKILYPAEVPENINQLPHKIGEFAVKFFGSHDHYWVNRGRTFLYHEGDGEQVATKSRVDKIFNKAMTEASEAFEKLDQERLNREAISKSSHKPPKYIKIQNNKYIGNVKCPEAYDANLTPCDCTPESNNPCGPNSDCINRLLMIECSPQVCPAKDKCCNQNFEKRLYPPLAPFKTDNRGWGLKTLVPLKKGDFVIEYVGEMIDEAEYQRRLQHMQKTKNENYYFLTIDKDRMLDAGPKGNKARFMNHSCLPNCETQKWTVNGVTRVGLFTLQDIPKDTELVFNYQLETIGNTKVECKCGAPNCSGYIGGKQPPKIPEKKVKAKPKKVTKRNKPLKITEDSCFTCGEGGELLLCDNASCPKAYHLSCLGLTKQPAGGWVCPWHQCSVCSQGKVQRCTLCINSYCSLHSEGNISLHRTLGLVCFNHTLSDSGSDWSESEPRVAANEDSKQMQVVGPPESVGDSMVNGHADLQ